MIGFDSTNPEGISYINGGFVNVNLEENIGKKLEYKKLLPIIHKKNIEQDHGSDNRYFPDNRGFYIYKHVVTGIARSWMINRKLRPGRVFKCEGIGLISDNDIVNISLSFDSKRNKCIGYVPGEPKWRCEKMRVIHEIPVYWFKIVPVIKEYESKINEYNVNNATRAQFFKDARQLYQKFSRKWYKWVKKELEKEPTWDGYEKNALALIKREDVQAWLKGLDKIRTEYDEKINEIIKIDDDTYDFS